MNIVVLEDGGSALAVALLSASAALCTAGIEMVDVPTACSVVSERINQCLCAVNCYALFLSRISPHLFSHPLFLYSYICSLSLSLSFVTQVCCR